MKRPRSKTIVNWLPIFAAMRQSVTFLHSIAMQLHQRFWLEAEIAQFTPKHHISLLLPIRWVVATFCCWLLTSCIYVYASKLQFNQNTPPAKYSPCCKNSSKICFHVMPQLVWHQALRQIVLLRKISDTTFTPVVLLI